LLKPNEIQIVTFNNPYPPNYGGVIDVFYKIKYLHKLNVDIYLHLYYDDRLDVSQLEPFCKKIYLYKRNKSILKLISNTPFSVGSRSSKKILSNLCKRESPILFEGLQSTHVLLNHTFKNKIIIRNHNVEHSYYYGLAKSETNIFHKWMFKFEGNKLKKYEGILNKADLLLPLSKAENEYFKTKYNVNVFFLPVFHENESISILTGMGDFALYHGDLSTSDNLKSVKFLISVFAELDQTLIIASSIISKSLEKIINHYDNIHFKQLKEDNTLLDKLFAKAQVNILHSNQQSGTKLKVFNSLYKGRHCIVNKNITDDKHILSLCKVAETKEEYKDAVINSFKEEYVLSELRETVLGNFTPLKSAIRLRDVIFNRNE